MDALALRALVFGVLKWGGSPEGRRSVGALYVANPPLEEPLLAERSTLLLVLMGMVLRSFRMDCVFLVSRGMLYSPSAAMVCSMAMRPITTSDQVALPRPWRALPYSKTLMSSFHSKPALGTKAVFSFLGSFLGSGLLGGGAS